MIILVISLILVAISVFIWRVSNAPLDIGFAKPYIQSSLRDSETGNYVLMEKVVLYWPDLKGPLYLQMHGGQLVNAQGSTIISVDSAAISFSRSALLSGRILPKSIILKKPTLRLLRNLDGEFEMDLGIESDKDMEQDQFDLTTRIFGYIARPGRESAQKSLISRLEEFHIEDASLFIDDKIMKQSWSLPNSNLIFKSTRKGMVGHVDLKLPNTGLDSSTINIDMNYIWDQKNVEISVDFKNIDIKAIAGNIPEIGVLAKQHIIFNAHVETILDETFMPSDLRVEALSERGDILHPDLSDNPIPYESLSLNALYNYNSRSLLIKDTSVTIGGVNVNASAEMEHGKSDVNGKVKVWIDELKQSQIDPLWPNILRGDNSEKWIVHRMSEGIFKNMRLGFNITAKKEIPEFNGSNIIRMGPFLPVWSADIDKLMAEFDFENMSVDYRAPLDKVANAYGSGRFDLNSNEINVEVRQAKLRSLIVSRATLLLDQVVTKGKGDVAIDVDLSGDIQEIMRYVSNDPINLDDDINMDIDKVKGQAELNIKLKFPARKDVEMKEFQIGIDGNLNNILFPDILKTLDLSGKSLKFKVKDGLASISGNAMLDNRPMKFSWEEFLNSAGQPYKEKITARITADPNIRGIMGIDLNDFIEGSLPVEVNYVSYVNGKSKADILIDVTPAVFFIDTFDFKKPAGSKASAKLTAYFKNKNIYKITNLTAEGDKFKIFKSNVSFKQENGETRLSSGKISKFILGETKSNLEFVYDNKGAVNIVMDAQFIDAQVFLGDEEKSSYQQPPMKISLTANKMQTAPEEIITNTKIYMDIDSYGRFNQMEMDAHIGEGDFRLRFKPDKDGRRIFSMRSTDAGAFLKAFNVYSNIRGGSLVIYGEPVSGVHDRTLRGKAEISDFRVVHAPALAKLLSVLSLGGIGEVLAGDGLSFEKLEADFNWLYRKSGALLVLKNGRTSGNSIGLLFDGTFDNQQRKVDVSGTIVPMSNLNKIIGSIPIIGDILTGGSGGVFAATYSLKGKSDDPEIFVNPLSILTPGILRRILWE